MAEPIEGQYFNWLCAKVLGPNPRSYLGLMRILYCTEFVWTGNVLHDQNRAEDGIELRLDFLRAMEAKDPDFGFEERQSHWYTCDCSVLEMLIAFAIRAADQTEISVKDWFMQFLKNLGLDEFRQVDESDKPVIEDILTTFIWRTYDSRGNGGLFPMRQTQNDQRDIEVWYQFCEYLDDQGLI